MNLTLTDSAVNWFLHELNLHPGDSMRFFVKYGGDSSIQPGFSLGMCQETPENVAVSTHKDGVVFFIRDDDVWYFEGKNLTVDFKSEDDDLVYAIS
ncbi:HesB/YadR/YfhF family protein [Alicyclobacillus tolerans]|uniref:HesB/YadR/YfhF family protein n=1 Tax=Alicyclobacillus tolerans TaxID=90970 RepID=UPI001F31F263|nr:HesB/YadR/YfhF family protein [Alicyclobacillus tolerans]MCF8566240.1 HesB/YadR/YfhF family protein [Alicyclobacillus tolerans]